MKKHSNKPVAALILASAMLSACTHVVVAEPPATEQNDFLVSEGLLPNDTATVITDERLGNQAIDSAAQQATLPAPPVMTPPPPPVVAQAPKAMMPAQHAKECTARDQAPYFNKAGMKTEEIKVRATGYGAPPKAYYSDAQRRLMSMRAAKIDAYRSLAERVKGVQIWGGTTIGDMVVENDRFRVFLDTYLVGAKLIMQTPHEDGSYEATVEMVIGQKMVKDLVDSRVMEAPTAMDDCVTPGSQHTRHEDREYTAPSRVAKSDFYFDRE